MYLFYRSFVWNHFKKKNIKNKKGLIVLTAVCDHCGNGFKIRKDSISRDMVTDKRNWLDCKTVREAMCLRSWWRELDS